MSRFHQTSGDTGRSKSISEEGKYVTLHVPEESAAFKVKGVAVGLPQPPWLGGLCPSNYFTCNEYDDYSSSSTCFASSNSSSGCSSVPSGPPRPRPPPLYRRQGSQRVRVPIAAHHKSSSRKGKESAEPVIFRDVQILTPGGSVVHVLQAMKGWKHFGFFTLDLKPTFDEDLYDYQSEDVFNLEHSPTVYRKEYEIRRRVDRNDEQRFREVLYEVYGLDADEEAEDTDDEEYIEYVNKLIRRRAHIPPPILTTSRTISQVVHDLDDYNDIEFGDEESYLGNSSDSDTKIESLPSLKPHHHIVALHQAEWLELL